jgi:mannose-6-phosphate isomerase-like protein (cupin superfamily)
MDRIAFEAELRRDGYDEIVDARLFPDHKPGDHSHPYDVRALILEGEFTIAVNGEPRTYRPGDIFALDAKRRHSEWTGPNGVTYLAGRRHGAGSSKRASA